MLVRHNILIVYINHSCRYLNQKAKKHRNIMENVFVMSIHTESTTLEMHLKLYLIYCTPDWVFPPTISSQLACLIVCTLPRWYVRKSALLLHVASSAAIFSFLSILSPNTMKLFQVNYNKDNCPLDLSWSRNSHPAWINHWARSTMEIILNTGIPHFTVLYFTEFHRYCGLFFFFKTNWRFVATLHLSDDD